MKQIEMWKWGTWCAFIISFYALIFVSSAQADANEETDCSYTQSGSIACVKTEKSSGIPFLAKIITPNSGTVFTQGQVARFTVFQTIKYNCPLTWDYFKVGIYVFNQNNLNQYADQAQVTLQGDNLQLGCNTALTTTLWYNTSKLPEGTYRLYASFYDKNGGTLSDPEYVTFTMSQQIIAPIAQETVQPTAPINSYVPPPVFTPSATSGTVFIPTATDKDNKGDGGNNNIALVLIALGAGLWLFGRGGRK